MPRQDIDITVPDLTGKRAVVTGASDGIGLGIALRLAAAGVEVVMPVRNPCKGEGAAARIREQIPDANVSLRALDLFLARLRRGTRQDPAGRGTAPSTSSSTTPASRHRPTGGRRPTASNSNSARTTWATSPWSTTCCPCHEPARPA